MNSVYVECPVCKSEIEVEMAYEVPEYDTNVAGGWVADAFTRSCTCPITTEQDDAIAAEAERKANADDTFGFTPAELDRMEGGY